MTGGYRGAAQVQEKALDIYRDIGNRGGQANALISLGIVRRVTGDYRGAAETLEEALDISRDITYRHGEAEILNETGALYRVRGDPTPAAEYHRQALTLSREIASPREEACALAGLGRCALALGRTSDAAENLRQARDIFQRIGAAEAAGLAPNSTASLGRDKPLRNWSKQTGQPKRPAPRLLPRQQRTRARETGETTGLPGRQGDLSNPLSYPASRCHLALTHLIPHGHPGERDRPSGLGRSGLFRGRCPWLSARIGG